MPQPISLGSKVKAQPKTVKGKPKLTRACLIGGKRMVRLGIGALLHERGLVVSEENLYDCEEHFAESVKGLTELPYDFIVLILSGGPFATIHRIREILNETNNAVPLVVLSDRSARGQVYAALRIGAKAFLDLDCEPDELAKAVVMASQNKVYLSSDVAELLVQDVSATGEPARSQRLPSVELSKREVEIVQLLCDGLSSKESARRLHLSAKTVENHRYNIYRKCGVDSIAGLMRHAIQSGLVSI